MRFSGAALWVAGFMLLAGLFGGPCSAQNWAGTTVGKPTFDRPIQGTPPSSTYGSATFRYEFKSFAVSTAGSYTLDAAYPVMDGYLFVYSGSFNPSSPLTNCLAANDDFSTFYDSQITLTLAVGTYVCVVSSYASGDTGDFTVTFTGPANVSFPPRVVSESPLATAGVGIAYSETLAAADGTAPYTWSVTGGALPGGLSLSTAGVISGSPTATGSFSFTVQAQDSSVPAQTASKSLTIVVINPPAAAIPFNDDFSTNKGWTFSAPWSRAAAATYSASTPPRSEPGTDATAASTDNMILGDTIGGDYAGSMTSTAWAVSPVVNCSSASAVQLRFQRWAGFSLADNAYIQVSNNGSTWTTVWEMTAASSNLNDSAWTNTVYDITSKAAGRVSVQVRFGIGTTDATVPNTGWCIDDLEIIVAQPALTVREHNAAISVTPAPSPLPGTLITDNQAVGGLRDFGQVATSTNSAIAYFIVTNNSGSAITLGSITKTGTNPTDFFLNPTGQTWPGFAGSLAAGASTYFGVQFYSTTGGVKTATLEFTHNAPGVGTSPFQVNVRAEAVAPTATLEVRLGSTSGTVVAHQAAAAGTPRDFGSWDIAAGPTATITIVLMNTGTAGLNINQPYVTPALAAEFPITLPAPAPTFPYTIAGGASFSFQVAFDPASVGAKAATLFIPHSNSPAQPAPWEIPLAGTGTSGGGGTAPAMAVKAGAATLANPAPATGPLNLGQVVVTSGSASVTIRIENTGTANLNVGVPTLSGATTEFSITGAGSFPASVGFTAPANFIEFTIVFDPTSAGVKNAQVQFTHNYTGTANPFVINVTGEGVAPLAGIEVHEGTATGTLVANGAAAAGGRDFGAVDVAAASNPSLAIVVKNTGNIPLTLGAATLTGTDAAHYVLNTAGFSATVAPGATTSFTVEFNPSTTGRKDAQVEFTQTAATPAVFVVKFTGKGTATGGLTITTASLPGGMKGTAYTTTTLAATGGSGALTWSLYSGSLPAGITLSAAGNISGTPTVSGGYSFTVRVADTAGNTDEKALSITVMQPLTGMGGGGGGGGCAASNATGMAGFAALLLALAWVARRRRRAA